MFWRSHRHEFEELRAAVQQAIAAQHQAGASAGVPAVPDVVDQLRQLGELRASGVLTEAEFQAQKQKLLNQ